MQLDPGGVVDGKEVKMEVKVGDQVIFSKYSGTEVKIEDTEYIIVKTERYSCNHSVIILNSYPNNK